MNWELLLQLIVNGLILGTLYGVVAMCFTLIYKASQVVNFAQGEFLLIGAWVCWWLLADLQLPFWAAFPMTLAFMMAFGILLQVVLLRPMIGEPIISVIMVTIGLSIFFQAVMKWIFGVIVQPFPPIFEADAVSILGLNVPAGLRDEPGRFAGDHGRLRAVLQIRPHRAGDAGDRIQSAGRAEPGNLGAEDVRAVLGDFGDGLGAGRRRLRHRQRRLLGAVAVRASRYFRR